MQRIVKELEVVQFEIRCIVYVCMYV